MEMIEKINNERFLLLQKQAPFMFLGSLLGGIGLIIALWSVVPHDVLLLWYGLLCLFWLVRLYHSAYLVRDLQYRLPTSFEKKYHYLYPIISGLFWGSGGVLFFTPDSITHLVYLLMYLFGIVMGGSVSLAYIRWAFPLYAGITILPISILLLSDDNEDFFWISFTLTFGILMIVAISHNVYRSISDSLRIRFENEALVETLKQQTVALEEQREAAIKANKDKSRFLASASHDLRQPIHALSLLTDALDAQVTTKEGRSILTLVHSANDSLNSLLGSLLDVSKLDAGIIEPKVERIDLVPFLNRISDTYRLMAKKKGLQLRLHLRDCSVDGDSSLLSNAIMNLIDNAIKYTLAGGVLVSTRIHHDMVKIQVWDTGIGIKKEDQKKIYHEFLQLGNSERDIDKGLGLGLSISKRLLQLLDYPLSLSSRLGQGSVFTISIPLSILPDEDSLALVSDTFPYSEKEAGTYTVLLIDDNHVVREATTLALKSWGYNVVSATCIDEVELLAENEKVADKIDIIVADYRLQDNVTGIEAIKVFKQLAMRELPAFLVTGDTAPERLQDAASFGLPLLHKPLKKGEFKMVLRNLISQKYSS